MKSIKQKGFTLVELLVVIAIIGLLSTIAVVSLGSARGKARDTKRIADVKQITTALEQFYNDNNGYPATADAAGTEIGLTATKILCSVITSGSTSFASSCAGTTYMGNIPSYPTPPVATTACALALVSTANRYCYMGMNASDAAITVWAAGNTTDPTYRINFVLENSNAALGGTLCIGRPSGISCS